MGSVWNEIYSVVSNSSHFVPQSACDKSVKNTSYGEISGQNLKINFLAVTFSVMSICYIIYSNYKIGLLLLY